MRLLAESMWTLFALGLVVAPSLASQLTVGPPGSGATFAQIQAAVDAAQTGDVILVQPGVYAPIDVAKGVTILGASPAGVVIDAPFAVGVTIRDLPVGERCVLSSVDVRATPFLGFGDVYSVGVHDCLGPVVLHDIRVGLQPFSPGPGIGVEVRDSAQVLLVSSEVLGAGADGLPAVEVLRSELFVADCTVVGLTNNFSGFVSDGAVGLRAEDATVRVWRTAIHGGDGTGGKPSFPFQGGDGGAGVVARSATVELYGGSVGDVRGGDGGPLSLFGVFGFGASGLVLEAGAEVLAQAALPVLGGTDGDGQATAAGTSVDPAATLTVVNDVYPSLSTTAPRLVSGVPTFIDLEGEPGGVQFLWYAADLGPTFQLAGVAGASVLDLASLTLLVVVPLDGAGHGQLAVAAPTAPPAIGAVVPFQAAAATASGFAISNPLVMTIPG